MFVICPASFDLVDAEWFDNVYEAKEEALDWSVELDGRNVIVYEALEDDDGAYEFNKLYAVFAWVQYETVPVVALSTFTRIGTCEVL